ncbi:MAG: hypothetical protein LBP26_04190 [Clostridiales bacterium]|jgi:cell division protein FtsL|nr:hypothetical protein [Clostridiales bacterium]
MVSSRRQISTERDKRGGYTNPRLIGGLFENGGVPASEFADKRTDSYSTGDVTARYTRGIAIDDKELERAANDVQTERPDLYSDAPETLAGRPALYTQAPVRSETEKPLRPAKPAAPAMGADNGTRGEVMPRIAPPRRAAAKTEPERDVKKTAVAPRTKVILAVYIAVVVVLAVIVIASGVAISSASESANMLETEIARKTELIQTQKNELDALSDPANIAAAAVANGMEKVENTEDMELIALAEPAAYEPRTNPFDKLCDFIGKIIGK